MQSIMVLPSDIEQKRALFAFLNAVGIKYFSTDANLEELEAQLLPKQKQVWDNLKIGLQWVDNGAKKDTLLTSQAFFAELDKTID